MSAYFEVQFKVSAFLAAQLTGLRSRQICPPPPQTIGGVSLRLMRIEFGPNAIRHNRPATFPVFYQYHGETIGLDADGFQTQIAQDLVLHITREDDVLSHPNQPPASVVAIPVRAVFDVDYYPLDTGCYLRMPFAGLEWGPLPTLPLGVDPEAAKAMVAALVANAFPSPAVPFNFANLLPGGVTRVENAGVSVSDDLQRFVLRAQLGGASSYAATPWSNFYSGFITDHTAGAEWAFFVGSGVLEGVFTNAVWAAVKENSASELQLISVGSMYSSSDGLAKVDTTIYANVDIPDPGGTEYVEPHVHSELSVSATNQLTIDVFLPDLQAVANELLAPVRLALRFLLGPLSTTFQMALDSAVRDIKAPSDIGLPNCAEVEHLHQRCTVRVPVPPVAGAQIRFTGLAALSDGVALTGRMTVPPLTPPTLETSVTEFKWVMPDVSCRSADLAFVAAFSNSAEQVAPVAAEVRLDHTGTTPVYLCDVKVVNDKLGKFPASGVRWLLGATLPTRILVEVPNPGPQYAAAPYPVDLLVSTTAGARLVRLPPAPPLTQKDIDRLTALLIGAIGNCFQLTGPPGFDLHWLVDPPYDKEVEHHWRLELDGVESVGELVQVADPAGNVLAEATVRPGQAARLTAVVAPAVGPELRVMRAAPAMRVTGGEGRDDANRGFGICQQLFEVEAAIPLDGVCRQVMASSWWSPRGVVAVLEAGLVAFDLTTPAHPRTVGRWPIDGLRGALHWPSGVLAIASERFVNIAADATMVNVGPACEPVAVLAATGGADVVHVLTATALETRSPRLCALAALPFAVGDAGGVVRVGSRLVVGGREGIAVVDVGRPGRQTPRPFPLDGVVVRLERRPMSDGGTVLATLDDGSARLLDVDANGDLDERARFPRPPWFAGSSRLGNVLVRVGDDARSLIVSRLGEGRWVGGDATAGQRT